MSRFANVVIGAVSFAALSTGLTVSASAAPATTPTTQPIVVPIGYAVAPGAIRTEPGPNGKLVTMSVTRGAHGSVTTHRWGDSIYMDGFLTGKVIAGFGGTGIIAMIAQALGHVAWPLAVAIAAIGVGLKLCQHQNDSVTIDIARGNFGTWWCS